MPERLGRRLGIAQKDFHFVFSTLQALYLHPVKCGIDLAPQALLVNPRSLATGFLT